MPHPAPVPRTAQASRLQWLPLLLLCLLALSLAGCATSPLGKRDRAKNAGRTYVITGASSGIGRGVALALGGQRANVVLAARGEVALESAAQQIAAAGGTPLVVVTDVSRPEEVQRLAAAAVARFGRIDVWINNAGVGALGPFEKIPVADHARVVDVNLKGVLFGSHAALTQFLRQGHGTLVNIGSVEGELPLAWHASYAATKAGVMALGRALNEELRRAGQRHIAVATVLPSATDTPFFRHAANYSGHPLGMILLDPPEKVVNVVLHTALHPREEVPVGWKGRAVYHGHRLLPDVAEWSAALIYERALLEGAPPAPDTRGNLYAPSPGAGAVRGASE
ncbi:MAG: family NAD(P)-dependent oxidoreductase [Moraxellaceae bacterium]|jgi:short-subunit dehydrogenase|nr:family NAD(P)-dependent oxidoreductase [Moraxellaceae bacterium]